MDEDGATGSPNADDRCPSVKTGGPFDQLGGDAGATPPPRACTLPASGEVGEAFDCPSR
ncbi:MAG: hypothetical protein R2873_23965 [Caldilineaceae bacterium]